MIDPQRLKRIMASSAIVLILCLTNTFRLVSTSNIRMVVILPLIALGIAIGVFIVTARMYFIFKKNNNG